MDKKPLCERKNFAEMVARNDACRCRREEGEGDIVEVKRSVQITMATKRSKVERVC